MRKDQRCEDEGRRGDKRGAEGEEREERFEIPKQDKFQTDKKQKQT